MNIKHKPEFRLKNYFSQTIKIFFKTQILITNYLYRFQTQSEIILTVLKLETRNISTRFDSYLYEIKYPGVQLSSSKDQTFPLIAPMGITF